MFRAPSRNSLLRTSGLLAIAVFLVMMAADLLLLTDLDFSRVLRFGVVAAGLPQAQVALGYYLGVLTIPLYCIGAWHFTLALKPGLRWAVSFLLIATAYSASLFTVWHASFAFLRSILRAEPAAAGVPGGIGPEASAAFEAFAAPLFRVGLAVEGAALVVLLGLIVSGRTVYPRWAGLALPAAFFAVALAPTSLLPAWGAAVLDAAGWNAAGLAMFALSTALLWNRGDRTSGS